MADTHDEHPASEEPSADAHSSDAEPSTSEPDSPWLNTSLTERYRGKFKPLQMPSYEQMLQQDAMDNCAVKSVIAGAMGAVLGVAFGVFTASLDTSVSVHMHQSHAACLLACSLFPLGCLLCNMPAATWHVVCLADIKACKHASSVSLGC